MKKLFLAVAAVAMVFATSCKKENVNGAEEPVVAGDNEFICVIDQNANSQNAPMVDDGMGTMAHIDASNNVWWQAGDKIMYIGQQVDAQGSNIGNLNKHELICSKMSDNRAYFSDDNKHFGQGTHEAYYPSSLVTGGHYVPAGTKPEQYICDLKLPATISLESGKNAGFLPMYGTGSGTHYITFHNICAVLKINIPTDITTCNQLVVSAGQHINGEFSVSDTTYKAQLKNNLVDANKTTTINAPSGEPFSGAVYVAIPEYTTDGGYSNFTVILKNVNGSTVDTLLYKSNPKKMSVKAGKIYPVTFKANTGLDSVFYFEARKNGATIELKQSGNAPAVSLEYYKEGTDTGCNKWKTYSKAISIDASKKLYFRAKSTNNRFATANNAYNYFDITAGSANIGGKLMYLIRNDGADSWPAADTYHQFAFCGLFSNDTSLYDISELIYPSTLQTSCFRLMFNGCTALNSKDANNASVKITLPATALPSSCYQDMFNGCTALSAPVEIKAKNTVSGSAMKSMFKNCYNLSNVSLPNAIEATQSNIFNSWLSGAGSSISGAKTVTISDVFTNTQFLGRNASGTNVQKTLYNLQTYLPSGWTIQNNRTDNEKINYTK